MNFPYSVLLDSPLSLITYSVLACTVLSLWIKRSYFVWGTLLAVAIGCGIASGRLYWPALIAMIVFAGICYFAFHAKYPTLKILCGLLIFIFSILLWYHKIPGFSNWLIVNGVMLSEDSLPFSM